MWNSASNAIPTVAFTATVCVFSSFGQANEAPLLAELPVYSASLKSGDAWSTGGQVLTEKLEQDVLNVGEMAQVIKESLGLPNKDIARILRVTRQTLHNYVTQNDEQTANASNRSRVLELYGVVGMLRDKLPHSPGAMAKNYFVDGASLLDLLSSEELDVAKIEILSNELAKKLNQNKKGEAEVNSVTLYQLTRHA